MPADDINTSKHSTASSKGSTQRRKSSFFARARASFARAGGNRGASVESLRGTKGANFEGKGYVTRGAPEGLCFWCGGDSRDRNTERFLLIKGPFCFVFASEKAPSPLFAIGLLYMKATAKKQQQLGSDKKYTAVLLENNLGDLEYEFWFESDDAAAKFCTVVERQAASAQAEAVRKRLGHDNLIDKRASLVFAENIAKAKESEQPDAPVTTEEVLSNIPQVAMYS